MPPILVCAKLALRRCERMRIGGPHVDERNGGRPYQRPAPSKLGCWFNL